MEKRFIIAIALVFLILFLWPVLFGRKGTIPESSPKKEQEVVQKEKTQAPPDKETVAQEEIQEIPEEKTISVQTPLYDIQFTNEKAEAVSWKLKEYYERVGKEELGHIDLIPQEPIPRADRNWLAIKFHDPEIQDEMEDVNWRTDKESVKVQNDQESIEFSYTTSGGIEISKKMTFSPDSYVVDLDISFQNRSSEEAKLGGYNLIWGPGIEKDAAIPDMEVAREGPVAVIRTEKGSQFVRHWKRTGFACFGGKHVMLPVNDGPISWVGFASKYFAAVLIPGTDSWWSDPGMAGKRYEITTDIKDTVLPAALSPKDVWQEWGKKTDIALIRPNFTIAAGEEVLHTYRIFVGPKKWDILRSVTGKGETTEKLGLGKMVDFGMFSPLGKATLWLLNFFHRAFHNYGVSIILLAVLIKILYLPLTQKSFTSMQKMQDIQPKIAALRERHRDDPQRLQQETMKIYKKHGVNPMGGCLPLLLQMPVFWALFTTLRGAVELRGTVFIPGWVTDLSLPDTVASVAGFPIRILPLLMTGTMLIQQLWFSTGTSGGSQSNKMMAMMPLFMLFIFYGMPSGLVLYWFCNNILTIGHQYMLKRNQSTETEDQDTDNDEGKKNRNTRK